MASPRIKTKTPEQEMSETAPVTVEPSPPLPLYYVTIRMQLPSHAGDPEYHLKMSENDILAVLSGKTQSIRLPERYGSVTETRFILITNVMEFTVDALTIPPQDCIAETYP